MKASYIRVEWEHDHPHEPITLYSELDDERWEIRKVEVFRSGRATYAWAKGETGTTRLGTTPVPSIAEIAANPEFTAREIDRVEFETVWETAVGNGDA